MPESPNATDVVRIGNPVDWAQALPELDFGPRKGGGSDYWNDGRCPTCGQKELFIYSRQDILICNRKERCGYRETVAEYLQKYRGLPREEAFARVAEWRGVNINAAPAQADGRQERRAKAARVQRLFVEHLWSPEGREVLDYFRSRGYSDDEIEQGGYGAAVVRAEIDAALGQGAAEAVGLAAPGVGTTHRAAFPVWVNGQVESWYIRVLDGNAPAGKKFLAAGGWRPPRPAGWDDLPKGAVPVLVEGVPDVAIGRVRGLPFVSSIGTRIAEHHLDTIAERGQIILAMDEDRGGREAFEENCKKLWKRGVTVYALDGYDGAKDPEELMRRPGGLERLKEIIRRARRAEDRYVEAAWRAAGDNTVSQDAAVRKLVDTAGKITNPLIAERLEAAIARVCGVKREAIARIAREQQEIERRKRLRENRRKLCEELTRAVEKDDEEAINSLARQFEQAPEENGVMIPLETEILNGMAGHKLFRLGYEGLDAIAPIYRGDLVYIAAPTGQGKTTFLANIALNALLRDTELRVSVISLEEAPWLVGGRMLRALAGIAFEGDCWGVLKDLFEGRVLIENEQDVRRIERAREVWAGIAGRVRVPVLRNGVTVRELGALLRREREAGSGLILLDYAQLAKPDPFDNAQDFNHMNRVSGVLRDAAREEGLVIIASSQINRAGAKEGKVSLHSLYRAAGLEHDGALVLGACKARGKLHVEVLKSRWGGKVGESVEIPWDGPTGCISDEIPRRLGLPEILREAPEIADYDDSVLSSDSSAAGGEAPSPF